MQLAANPNSDEMVLVVNHANETDCALVWDGSSWGNVVTLATTTSQDRTDINVAYEQQSGEALVVFEDDTNSNALFQTWNGAVWSGPAPGTVTAPRTVTGYARWTTLAADPQSDRIVLGVLSTDRDVWLAVWNGSGWEPAVAGTLTANGNTFPNVAVAFESNSGQALATYGEASNLRYRTWSGGTWSGELPDEPSIGGNSNSMTLDADRNSDQIMLSVQDAESALNYVVWDGTSWASPDELETHTPETKNQPFVFVWNSGREIVIDGQFSEWDDGIGNEFCIVDQCGADDWTNPDRLDLTKMCIASNQQDTIYNLLAVDDVDPLRSDHHLLHAHRHRRPE